MTLTKKELNMVLTGKSTYCGLCLREIANFYLFEDEVIFGEGDNKELISTIMCSVLGIEVGDLTSRSLCIDCTEIIVKFYKFVLKIKKNVQNVKKAVENVDQCLKNYMEMETACKTLYLAIDTENFFCDTYYDQHLVLKNHKIPLMELESTIKKEDSILKIELEPLSNESDSFETEDNNKCTLDKKRSNEINKYKSTLTIPTREMKYNKMDSSSFKCKLCLQTYPRAGNLRQHYIRVHSPKLFKCKDCSKSYGSKSLLTQHVADSHTLVVCTECGKSYSRVSLKSHLLSHTQRFVCPLCGKVFKNETYFKKHTKLKICDKSSRKESQEKYTCDYCYKSYSSKQSLKVHITLEHENGKYYECEWCKKKFSANSRLKDHIVKHTREKKFCCNLCGGRFVTKASLTYHTRLHTGEKPYKCDFCDLRFLSSSRRAAHLKTHKLSKEIIECDICKSKFSSTACMKRHKKKHNDPNSRLHYNQPTDVL